MKQNIVVELNLFAFFVFLFFGILKFFYKLTVVFVFCITQYCTAIKNNLRLTKYLGTVAYIIPKPS